MDGLETPNDSDYIELDQLQVRPQQGLHAAKAAGIALQAPLPGAGPGRICCLNCWPCSVSTLPCLLCVTQIKPQHCMTFRPLSTGFSLFACLHGWLHEVQWTPVLLLSCSGCKHAQQQQLGAAQLQQPCEVTGMSAQACDWINLPLLRNADA